MKKEIRMHTIQQPYDIYISDDGIPFPSKELCAAYENKVLYSHRDIVKNLQQWDLNIPFVGWDMEPDTQKMYLLHNEGEWIALNQYYVDEYSNDFWYGDPPGSYPTAYIVLGRDCYGNGWELNGEMTEGWRKLYELTKTVHEKIIREATESYKER